MISFSKAALKFEKVNSVALAKRVMMNQSFDMVLFYPGPGRIWHPFGQGNPVTLRCARTAFVRQDGYDQACYTVMDQMIFVMQMPVHKPLVNSNPCGHR